VADELKADYPDAQIELIEGRGGIFEVKRDGRRIYSKRDTPERRFPGPGEISKLIG
jgi:hypothetical protein